MLVKAMLHDTFRFEPSILVTFPLNFLMLCSAVNMVNLPQKEAVAGAGLFSPR